MPARRGQHGAFAAGGNYKATNNGYAGGSKKSGTGYNGIGMRATTGNILRTDAVPSAFKRNMIYPGTNQLGGIGVGRSIFAASGFPGTGGARKGAPFQFVWKGLHGRY